MPNVAGDEGARWPRRSAVLLGAAGRRAGQRGGDDLDLRAHDGHRCWPSPRLLFSMAERGELPPILARVHPRFRTPHVAILAYAALDAGLRALRQLHLERDRLRHRPPRDLRAHLRRAARLPAPWPAMDEPGFRAAGRRAIVAPLAVAFCLWLLSTRTFKQAWVLAAAAWSGLAARVRLRRRATAEFDTRAGGRTMKSVPIPSFRDVAAADCAASSARRRAGRVLLDLVRAGAHRAPVRPGRLPDAARPDRSRSSSEPKAARAARTTARARRARRRPLHLLPDRPPQDQEPVRGRPTCSGCATAWRSFVTPRVARLTLPYLRERPRDRRRLRVRPVEPAGERRAADPARHRGRARPPPTLRRRLRERDQRETPDRDRLQPRALDRLPADRARSRRADGPGPRRALARPARQRRSSAR